MRPVRSRLLQASLILPLLLAGCSERASRLTGNERLLRGGLGTTTHGDTLVDRDTYVPPIGSPIKGATLVVGQLAAYEARSLFHVTTWTLPDTNDVIDSVLFKIELDPNLDAQLPPVGSPYSLHTAAVAWDTTTVDWPGPPLGLFLGSGPDSVAPMTIDLGASAISLVRAWAQDPAFPGFVLTLETAQGVRGFIAGTARFEIVSHRTVSGLPVTATAVTRIPTDLSIHTPIPAASGTETALRLGGLYRAAVLLHAPVPRPPAGFSLNGAALVAYLDPSVQPFPSGKTVEIRAFRIRNPWVEGVAADSGLGLDATALSVLSAYRVNSVGDSIVIPIPIAVAREWAADSTANQGVLLRVTDSFKSPELLLQSRESSRPPVGRANTTSPPPGRF